MDSIKLALLQNDPMDSLTVLLSQLQHKQQTLSAKVDFLANQIQQNLPKLPTEVDQLKEDLLELVQYLDSVKQLKSSNSELNKLHLIKSRMQQARQHLKQTESWSTLEQQVEQFISKQDFDQACLELTKAKKSLKSLFTKDLENKQQLLLKLVNKLESILSPKLIQCLNDRDLEGTRRIYNNFEQIGRKEQFFSFYFNNKKKAILTGWGEFDRNFDEWIKIFFNDLISRLKLEFDWIRNLPINPAELIYNLLYQSFIQFEPSFKQRLEQVANDNWISVGRVYQETVIFCEELETSLFRSTLTMDGVDSNELITLDDTVDLVAWKPLHSNWNVFMLQQFLHIQQNYGQFEEKFLLNSMQKLIVFNKKMDQLEQSRNLSEAVIKLVNNAESAIQRCLDLTFGYGLVGLVDAVNIYLVAALNRYTKILNEMAIELGIEPIFKDQKNRKEKESLSEWTTFQAGVRFLSIACNLQKRVTNLENKIKLIKPINSVGNSMGNLLHQSSLNNVKLQSILKEEYPLKPTFDQLQAFSMNCQRFVFNVLLMKIDVNLKGIGKSDTNSTFKLPQFSTSPSTAITLIGEHLLSLPQQLELYTDEESLGFCIEQLCHLTREDLELLKDQEETQFAILHLWLSSLSRETMHQLEDHFKKFEFLSEFEWKQLDADLTYLLNVFSAMDISVPRIQLLHKLVQMDKNELMENMEKDELIAKVVELKKKN